VLLQMFASSQAASAAAAPLQVDIVGDDKTLWQELLPALGPLVGALAGGIGGVIIGSKMQRKTLEDVERDRHAREDQREQKRAKREDAREQQRAERDDHADRRRAIGALRIARRYFAGVLRHTKVAAEKRDYAFVKGMEVPLRPEEEHLIGTWITDDEWLLYSLATGRVRVLDMLLTTDTQGKPTLEGLRTLRDLHVAAQEAVLAFQNAQDQLAKAVGEVPHDWPELVTEFPSLEELKEYPEGESVDDHA
jgi:hypothetical protein